MADHVLMGGATKTVTINGRDYEMEVGNVTVALDIADWLEAINSTDGSDMAQFRAIAETGRSIVSSALGEQAAEDLIGRRHRLDLLRMVQILNIVAEEMSAEDAMAELRQAMGSFADTADDD